jgi:uncharacterized protein (DUF697 family)
MKISEANKIVNNYMLGAIGVGLVPIPLVDLVVLSGLQLNMLHRLAQLYNLDFSRDKGKALIAALLGGTVPLSFSRHLISLSKSIPIYGPAVGIISMSTLGGASTYAIGKVFIQHFESGGTFLTFDPQQVSTYYAQQLKKGTEEAKKSYIGIKP